jgi:hypothetical protein
MSEQGIRMGRIVGEYILMRYFFPDTRDLKIMK